MKRNRRKRRRVVSSYANIHIHKICLVYYTKLYYVLNVNLTVFLCVVEGYSIQNMLMAHLFLCDDSNDHNYYYVFWWGAICTFFLPLFCFIMLMHGGCISRIYNFQWWEPNVFVFMALGNAICAFSSFTAE